MRVDALDHEFVDNIPGAPDEGKLFISIRYRTAVHLCACGCGLKVVTPLRPSKWKLIFDGDSVSLTPSIGSWQFPCRSHYWIKNNEIVWSRPWTDEEIAAGRHRDADDVRRYYAVRGAESSASGDRTAIAERKRGLLAAIRRRLWRRVGDK